MPRWASQSLYLSRLVVLACLLFWFRVLLAWRVSEGVTPVSSTRILPVNSEESPRSRSTCIGFGPLPISCVQEFARRIFDVTFRCRHFSNISCRSRVYYCPAHQTQHCHILYVFRSVVHAQVAITPTQICSLSSLCSTSNCESPGT